MTGHRQSGAVISLSGGSLSWPNRDAAYYFYLTDGHRLYLDRTGHTLAGPVAARQHALEDASTLLESWMVRSTLPWVHDRLGSFVAASLWLMLPFQRHVLCFTRRSAWASG